MARYGRKGGASANTGRRAVTYKATLPDGRVIRKRSFHVDQAVAALGCYEHDGQWYASGIADSPQSWPGQIFIEATRV